MYLPPAPSRASSYQTTPSRTPYSGTQTPQSELVVLVLRDETLTRRRMDLSPALLKRVGNEETHHLGLTSREFYLYERALRSGPNAPAPLGADLFALKQAARYLADPIISHWLDARRAVAPAPPQVASLANYVPPAAPSMPPAVEPPVYGWMPPVPALCDSHTLYQAAELELNAGNFEAAMSHINLAITAPNSGAMCYSLRARLHMRRGAYQDAAVDFRTCAIAFPQDLDIQERLAHAYSGFDHQKSSEIYTEILALNPYRSSALKGRARQYYKLNLWDAALADYTAALALEPNNARIYCARAQVHAARGDIPQALADLVCSADLAPDDHEALTLYSALYAKLGHADAVIATLTQALNVSPLRSELYLVRAKAYLHNKNWAEAAVDCGLRLAAAPNNLEALLARAAACLQLNNHEASIADCENILLYKPAHPSAHYQLGAAYEASGRWQLAYDAYTRSLNLNKHEMVYQHRARVMFQMGQYVAAEADLTAAHAIAPSDVGPLADRLTLRKIMGNIQGALADSESLLALQAGRASAALSRSKKLFRV